MEIDGKYHGTALEEAISHLLAAVEAAKRAEGQEMLVSLIEAVLLHAGREIAEELER